MRRFPISISRRRSTLRGTINKLKGKVTMLFITHQIPRGLAVDEVIELGANTNRQMEVVEEEK